MALSAPSWPGGARHKSKHLKLVIWVTFSVPTLQERTWQICMIDGSLGAAEQAHAGSSQPRASAELESEHI